MNQDATQDLLRLGRYYESKKDFSKMKKYYLEAIEGKDKSAEAMYLLGKYYHGVRKNMKKAKLYYSMAADAHYPLALSALHEHFPSVEKDSSERLRCLHLASDQGDMEAMYALGTHYHCLQDFESAKKYYKLASAKEHVGALVSLALLSRDEEKDYEAMKKYSLLALSSTRSSKTSSQSVLQALRLLCFYYQSVEKNEEELLKYYQEAISRGSVEALYDLGAHYESLGAFDEMKKYYSLAAHRQYSPALHRLAMHFQLREADHKEMERLYKLAIEQGFTPAMCSLGLFYAEERGDIVAMKKLYERAIELQDPHAMYLYGSYYEGKKKYKKMVKFYLMAVEKRQPEACFALGRYYQHVLQDYEEMKSLYWMAVDQGHVGAMHQLGEYFQFEEQDFSSMRRLYERAVEQEHHYQSLQNLVLYLVGEKDYEEVLRLSLLAYRHHPESIQPTLTKSILTAFFQCYSGGEVPLANQFLLLFLQSKHASIEMFHDLLLRLKEHTSKLNLYLCYHFFRSFLDFIQPLGETHAVEEGGPLDRIDGVRMDILHSLIKSYESPATITYYELVQQATQESTEGEPEECCICFEHHLILTPKCKHALCKNCFIRLAQCPLCREHFREST